MSAPEIDASEKARRDRKDQVRHGLTRRAVARKKRALAKYTAHYDPTGARLDRRDADDFERYADLHLTLPEKPQQGTGGELHLLPADARQLPGLVDTAAEPDLVTARASLERLDLAARADVLELGADAAETIGARNSLERMLAHQMAAAHRLAMTFTEHASQLARQANPHAQRYWRDYSQEAARLAGACQRMMLAFNDGLRTLERVRNGGKQTVVVQHVEVRDHGQAVVAGAIESRKGRKGGGDGRL